MILYLVTHKNIIDFLKNTEFGEKLNIRIVLGESGCRYAWPIINSNQSDK